MIFYSHNGETMTKAAYCVLINRIDEYPFHYELYENYINNPTKNKNWKILKNNVTLDKVQNFCNAIDNASNKLSKSAIIELMEDYFLDETL